MKKWVIFRLNGTVVNYVDKMHSGFTEDVNEAGQYDDESFARSIAATIKTPLMVQEIEIPDNEVNTRNFPVPDFFEVVDPRMDVDELIQLIRQDELAVHFTPVDEITGGNQMTGRALADQIDGRLVGREMQFSFSRILSDSDIQVLYDAIRATKAWDAVTYVIRRCGFTAYAVLTLRASRK